MRCARQQRRRLADRCARGAPDSGGGAPAAQYAAHFWRRSRRRSAEELNNELVWYANLLGQVRDREVLSSRLNELIADLPVDHVRGPVEAEITKTLATERDDATQRLNRAMRTGATSTSCSCCVAGRQCRRLTTPPMPRTRRGQVRGKGSATGGQRLRKADDDIERLHRARKAAKRLRYAAELVEPADNQMKGIARDARNCKPCWASIKIA